MSVVEESTWMKAAADKARHSRLSRAIVCMSCTGRPVHSFRVVSQSFHRHPCNVAWKAVFDKMSCWVTWPCRTRWGRFIIESRLPGALRGWQPVFVQSHWFHVVWTKSEAGTCSQMPRFFFLYRWANTTFYIRKLRRVPRGTCTDCTL